MTCNIVRIIDCHVQNIVGKNVKKYRLKLGMSQKELSDRLEICAIYIDGVTMEDIILDMQTLKDYERKNLVKYIRFLRQKGY